MFLKKIILNNFKTYRYIEFECNDKFNIIIGENNIGKSTFYDALLLWNLAYLKLIKKDKKGFYKKTSYNSMKINFTKFAIFRLINTSDLFFNSSKSAKITLCIEENSNEFDLEIELNKPDIENSYIRFMNDKNQFDNFAHYCNNHEPKIKLDEAIKIRLTKPISSILKQEVFSNKAFVQNKTFLGLSHEVLRNKILTTIENKNFDFLQQKLEEIFNDKYTIRFKNNNREDNEFINITIQKANKKEVDLALVGSGILHALEIFSTIKNEQDPNTINLLLLDEPDAHIHANIQVKLIESLKNEKSLQTFVITHNDRLMKKAEEGELFYISEERKNMGKLNAIALEDYKIVTKDIAKSLLNDVDKPILFVEDEYYQLYKIAYLKINDIDCTEENFESLFDQKSYFTIKTGKSAGGVAGLLRVKDVSLFEDKKIIGLFDFDKEGRENFYNLGKENFWDKDNDVQGNVLNGFYKKRKDCKNMYSMLLPIPKEKQNLVCLDWDNFVSYMEIENLFSDIFLQEQDFVEEKEAPGNLKYLKVKKNIKNRFWKLLFSLDKQSFTNFKPLFDRVREFSDEND